MTEPSRTARTGAWSSALSTNDFAATRAMGLQPLAFVQGCSVVSWGFLGAGAPGARGYYEQFPCPHGFVSADHRLYGYNYEQTWLEEAWFGGLRAAYDRLLDEARRYEAHGVIGVSARVERLAAPPAVEFSLSGTAVALEGSAAPGAPFTTFLAGQKLRKLVEAGFAPVAIAVGFASVGVLASCVTEYQLRGVGTVTYGAAPVGEIDQLVRAHTQARALARERVRDQLGGDVLHAARLVVREVEAAGGPQVEAELRGNRVRRFKDVEPLPPPRPVVRLVDR
ncbi:MAG TPA: hypothetical protein VKV23_05105 [Acidimicrobiales bacterium]|nr:hypothetical protein [Acidimicrobiales bacterium]